MASPQEHRRPSAPQQDYHPSSQPSSSQYRQQQQQPQPQPPPSSSQQSHAKSKSRSFSLHSDNNRRRSSSKPEHDQETPEEKEARRIRTKADPTLAISEAEPAAIAAMTESRLSSIRDITHRDRDGNPIANPDLSNPTRSRFERPLDTIRGFEAAINGAYRRQSMVRAETDSVANFDRRSSYHPGGQPRYRPDSYYGSRPQSMRPSRSPYVLGVAPSAEPETRSSMVDGRGHYDDYTQSYMPGPIRQAPPRLYSDPYRHYGGGGGPDGYHLAHQDRSYETVPSAEGSGQSDQMGYQTDPTSSDNSSIERHSPARRPEPKNDYGIGFSQPQPYQNLSLGGNHGNRPPAPPPHGTAQQGGRPPVPRKEVPSVLRRQSTQQTQQQAQKEKPAAPDKKKNWLRRFSKNF